MSMIRLELLQEFKGRFHTIGMHTLVGQDYFVLTDLDRTPRLVNAYPVYFDNTSGETLRPTHLGIFPDIEYTGMVTPLTSALKVKKGEHVTFGSKTIVMTMVTDCHTGITVIKGNS